MAMAGAAATIATGRTTAIATIVSTARRSSEMSGDDSSTTGKSAHADIDHSAARLMSASGATSAGRRSGAQNATATSRRAGVSGQSMSRSAARVGRVAASAKSTGNTT